jgi:uncharacterized protein involved in exopolysaccharide biosynthesis
MESSALRNPDIPAHADGEFILPELVRALWKGRVLIFGICLVCVLAAAAASWLYPKKYEATLLMSPVTNQSAGGGLGALGGAVSSQLGGLASLAGLSLGSGSGAKAESLATLQSEALTQRYIQEKDLLPVLFPRKWDAQQKKWKSSAPDKVPTLWKGNQYFTENIRDLKENARTGLATLTIRWTDAKMAAEWANDLVKLANDYLRDKAIRESDRNIAYLKDQLTKTSDVGLQQSIYSLMESEIKKEMIARGSEEYAIKVIDPAVAPEKAVSPKPTLWILAAFCIGLILSCMYIILKRMVAPRIED